MNAGAPTVIARGEASSAIPSIIGGSHRGFSIVRGCHVGFRASAGTIVIPRLGGAPPQSLRRSPDSEVLIQHVAAQYRLPFGIASQPKAFLISFSSGREPLCPNASSG